MEAYNVNHLFKGKGSTDQLQNRMRESKNQAMKSNFLFICINNNFFKTLKRFICEIKNVGYLDNL